MFKPLERLNRTGWGKVRQKKLQVYLPEGPAVVDQTDPTVREIMQRCGDRPGDMKMAKRVAKLYQNGSTETGDGTIPELITYDWLTINNIPFTFQAWVYGGRSRLGGVVPDFVLEHLGVGLAWLVQGEYWHSKPEISASDIIDRLRLIGSWFHGIYIEKVVELWEEDIYFRRPTVFEHALLGISLRE